METNQKNSNNDEGIFFQKLPKEQRWSIIKSLLDFYNHIISTKMSVLPILSALSAAMVVIATLNKELINIEVVPAKVILSILLSLIPISLLIFIRDTEKGAEGIRKDIEKYIGKVETKPSISDWISSYTPIVITTAYFLITIYLLYIIWCN